MKTALRRYAQNEEVHASVAPSNDFYICGFCKGPVDRRAGQIRDPYFAHQRGYGTPACEYYVSTYSAAGAGRHSDPQQKQITLSLELGHPSETRGWGLKLSVPIFGTDVQEVTIDVGGRVLSLKGTGADYVRRVVAAEPQASSYWVQEIRPAYCDLAFKLQRECEGLRSEGATLFGDIRDEEESIVRASEILLGGSYVLIWSTCSAIQIPEAFCPSFLDVNGEWIGAVITVPPFLEAQHRTWLEEVSRLPIMEVPTAFIPIWPPFVHTMNLRQLCVQDTKALIISVANTANNNSTNAVFAASQEQEKGVGLDAHSRFIKLAHDERAEVLLRSTDKDPGWLQISHSLFSATPAVSVVVTGHLSDGSSISAGLHEMACANLLNMARAGEVVLTEVSIAPGCKGTLLEGRSGVWLSSQDANGSDNVLQWLVEAIKKKALDIAMDFGPLGRCVCKSNDSMQQAELPLADKSHGLLKAYLFQMAPRLHHVVSRKSSVAQLMMALQRAPGKRSALTAHRFLKNKI